MLKAETFPNTNLVQTEITENDYNILVDWLCRMHYKSHLSTASFSRCIGLLARVFALVNIELSKLVGCTCMLIASKVEGTKRLTYDKVLAFFPSELKKEDLRIMETYTVHGNVSNTIRIVGAVHFIRPFIDNCFAFATIGFSMLFSV